MADIEIRGLDDDLFEKLQKSARVRDISVNQQITAILKQYFTFDGQIPGTKSSYTNFLQNSKEIAEHKGEGPVKTVDRIVGDGFTDHISSIRFEARNNVIEGPSDQQQ